jgi:hypothetical protein
MPQFEKEMVMLRAQAIVEETVLSEDSVRAAINAAIEKANKEEGAATDPVGPNQKPRMLHISAWICHAGEPNRNGAGFLKEDLEEAVNSGLFVAPYFGMIDWNHDFNSYGCWYKAEFAFDPKANEWGILAHGAVFAWRYSEVADKVLAMMSRQGWVDVSMACMPGWYEPAKDKAGTSYRLIRKPVFFTTSLLDVDPADPNGRGKATEDSNSPEEQRTRELSQASLGNGTDNQEAIMDELIQKVEAMLGEQKAELTPLIEAALKLPGVEQALTDALAKAEQAQAAHAALGEDKAALETAKAELEVALAAAKEQAESMAIELASLREFKAGIEATEAERAAQAKRDGLLSQVPAPVLAALDKSEKKEDIISDWMKLSDAEWALKLESFALAGHKSMGERSAEEGSLSSATEPENGGFAITKFRNRRK